MRNVVLCSAVVMSFCGVVYADDDDDDGMTSYADGDATADSALNRFNAEFDVRIPIAVPRFHGIEPRLALHHHGEERNGYVGWGWSMHGIRQIQRAAPGRGVATWGASDVFLLDGVALVPCTPTS